MDPTLYKHYATSRGLTYRYYHQPPLDSTKHTLLFLHGFPSSASDWQRQIVHFVPRGYGVLAPDMLGSGGTARPLNPKEFKLNLMAQDLVEILDREGLEKVVGVAHDWGCVALSRLSMLHPDRFHAFAWLGLSFMEPATFQFDLDAVMAAMKQLLGYEGYAYWAFFRRPDASSIIETNVDSFIQLLYPKDPTCWLTYMALPGKTAEWVEGNHQPGRAEYLTEEEYAAIRKNIVEDGGIRSSLNWYLAQLENVDLQDNLQIPQSAWQIRGPSFFAVALADCICTPKRGRASMDQFGGGQVTSVGFDAGHWVHLEQTEAVNRELEKWLQGLRIN